MENVTIPSVTINNSGHERRAGFEFEACNVSIEQLANALHKEYLPQIQLQQPIFYWLGCQCKAENTSEIWSAR